MPGEVKKRFSPPRLTTFSPHCRCSPQIPYRVRNAPLACRDSSPATACHSPKATSNLCGYPACAITFRPRLARIVILSLVRPIGLRTLFGLKRGTESSPRRFYRDSQGRCGPEASQHLPASDTAGTAHTLGTRPEGDGSYSGKSDRVESQNSQSEPR
jgi:hypothetical protein